MLAISSENPSKSAMTKEFCRALLISTIFSLKTALKAWGSSFNSPTHKAEVQLFYKTDQLTTVSYDEIKQKLITQANDYHRVKAYTP